MRALPWHHLDALERAGKVLEEVLQPKSHGNLRHAALPSCHERCGCHLACPAAAYGTCQCYKLGSVKACGTADGNYTFLDVQTCSQAELGAGEVRGQGIAKARG